MALEKHAQSQRLSSFDHFNAQKAQGFKITANNISLDFSNQRLNQNTVDLLINLAKEQKVTQKINALFRGDIVNPSEKRPALHTALRTVNQQPIWVDKRDIIPDILATREKMHLIATQLREGKWLGYSGLPIQAIVNIGIGGSDFGPRFCVTALADFATKELSFHFVSDVDPKAFENAVMGLKPETTLFIVSSKSFTTKETLYNATKALNWFNSPENLDQHFIAVTANAEKAQAFGIHHVLPIWDWVGGRYSLCSAINLITCIAIGYEHFSELLAGANSMDEHFLNKDLHENMPLILALIGLWNINFLHIPSLLLLVYAKQLEHFVPYIQQLDMESNGKSIDNQGRAVNYATGPIVWGGSGNQAQHSYYQLLCQGTHKIAADVIATEEFNNDLIHTFRDAKIQVLSKGINPPHNPNGYIPGGMPINNISLKSCDPFSFGALIALYEHKIYIQGVLWNINSFDQPGVESAKGSQKIAQDETAVY